MAQNQVSIFLLHSFFKGNCFICCSPNFIPKMICKENYVLSKLTNIGNPSTTCTDLNEYAHYERCFNELFH